MSDFNTHRWIRNKYIAKAGLAESQADLAAKAIDKAIAEVDEDGNCINPCVDAKPFIFIFLYLIIIAAVLLFIYAIIVTIRVVEELNIRSRVMHDNM